MCKIISVLWDGANFIFGQGYRIDAGPLDPSNNHRWPPDLRTGFEYSLPSQSEEELWHV
jgi:hypothetical protein